MNQERVEVLKALLHTFVELNNNASSNNSVTIIESITFIERSIKDIIKGYYENE